MTNSLLVQLIVFLIVSIISIWQYIRGDIEVRIAILLIASMLIPDIWVLIKYNWPETENIEYNLWLSKDYNVKLNVLWYLYGMGSYFSKFLLAYIFIKITIEPLPSLRIPFCYIAFTLTQFAFWLWNKNTSIYANSIVYIYIILIIMMILIPNKPTGKLKQF